HTFFNTFSFSIFITHTNTLAHTLSLPIFTNTCNTLSFSIFITFTPHHTIQHHTTPHHTTPHTPRHTHHTTTRLSPHSTAQHTTPLHTTTTKIRQASCRESE